MSGALGCCRYACIGFHKKIIRVTRISQETWGLKIVMKETLLHGRENSHLELASKCFHFKIKLRVENWGSYPKVK